MRNNSRRRGREVIAPTERQIAYLAELLGSESEAVAFARGRSRKAVSAKISEINFAIVEAKKNEA